VHFSRTLLSHWCLHNRLRSSYLLTYLWQLLNMTRRSYIALNLIFSLLVSRVILIIIILSLRVNSLSVLYTRLPYRPKHSNTSWNLTITLTLFVLVCVCCLLLYLCRYQLLISNILTIEITSHITSPIVRIIQIAQNILISAIIGFLRLSKKYGCRLLLILLINLSCCVVLIVVHLVQIVVHLVHVI